MPRTLERIESAIMFAKQCSKESEPWRAAAYLRAALAEYCSIEEIQKLDQVGAKHFRVGDSKNPLIHLLKLLRHLNIHVKSNVAAKHSINVSLGDQIFDMDVYVISDINVMELTKLRNGIFYTQADLERCVDWFNQHQSLWGAGDLIDIGTSMFAIELAEHYGL